MTACDAGADAEAKVSVRIRAGWRHEWRRPPPNIRVHEIVPGPFKKRLPLVEDTPFYIIETENLQRKSCRPRRKRLNSEMIAERRYSAIRTGIPDPWADYLTFRGTPSDITRVSAENKDLWAAHLDMTEAAWKKHGIKLTQGIPNPWEFWPKLKGLDSGDDACPCPEPKSLECPCETPVAAVTGCGQQAQDETCSEMKPMKTSKKLPPKTQSGKKGLFWWKNRKRKQPPNLVKPAWYQPILEFETQPCKSCGFSDVKTLTYGTKSCGCSLIKPQPTESKVCDCSKQRTRQEPENVCSSPMVVKSSPENLWGCPDPKTPPKAKPSLEKSCSCSAKPPPPLVVAKPSPEKTCGCSAKPPPPLVVAKPSLEKFCSCSAKPPPTLVVAKPSPEKSCSCSAKPPPPLVVATPSPEKSCGCSKKPTPPPVVSQAPQGGYSCCTVKPSHQRSEVISTPAKRSHRSESPHHNARKDTACQMPLSPKSCRCSQGKFAKQLKEEVNPNPAKPSGCLQRAFSPKPSPPPRPPPPKFCQCPASMKEQPPAEPEPAAENYCRLKEETINSPPTNSKPTPINSRGDNQRSSSRRKPAETVRSSAQKTNICRGDCYLPSTNNPIRQQQVIKSTSSHVRQQELIKLPSSPAREQKLTKTDAIRNGAIQCDRLQRIQEDTAITEVEHKYHRDLEETTRDWHGQLPQTCENECVGKNARKLEELWSDERRKENPSCGTAQSEHKTVPEGYLIVFDEVNVQDGDADAVPKQRGRMGSILKSTNNEPSEPGPNEAPVKRVSISLPENQEIRLFSADETSINDARKTGGRLLHKMSSGNITDVSSIDMASTASGCGSVTSETFLSRLQTATGASSKSKSTPSYSSEEVQIAEVDLTDPQPLSVSPEISSVHSIESIVYKIRGSLETLPNLSVHSKSSDSYTFGSVDKQAAAARSHESAAPLSYSNTKFHPNTFWPSHTSNANSMSGHTHMERIDEARNKSDTYESGGGGRWMKEKGSNETVLMESSSEEFEVQGNATEIKENPGYPEWPTPNNSSDASNRSNVQDPGPDTTYLYQSDSRDYLGEPERPTMNCSNYTNPKSFAQEQEPDVMHSSDEDRDYCYNSSGSTPSDTRATKDTGEPEQDFEYTASYSTSELNGPEQEFEEAARYRKESDPVVPEAARYPPPGPPSVRSGPKEAAKGFAQPARHPSPGPPSFRSSHSPRQIHSERSPSVYIVGVPDLEPRHSRHCYACQMQEGKEPSTPVVVTKDSKKSPPSPRNPSSAASKTRDRKKSGRSSNYWVEKRGTGMAYYADAEAVVIADPQSVHAKVSVIPKKPEKKYQRSVANQLSKQEERNRVLLEQKVYRPKHIGKSREYDYLGSTVQGPDPGRRFQGVGLIRVTESRTSDKVTFKNPQNRDFSDVTSPSTHNSYFGEVPNPSPKNSVFGNAMASPVQTGNSGNAYGSTPRSSHSGKATLATTKHAYSENAKGPALQNSNVRKDSTPKSSNSGNASPLKAMHGYLENGKGPIPQNQYVRKTTGLTSVQEHSEKGMRPNRNKRHQGNEMGVATGHGNFSNAVGPGNACDFCCKPSIFNLIPNRAELSENRPQVESSGYQNGLLSQRDAKTRYYLNKSDALGPPAVHAKDYANYDSSDREKRPVNMSENRSRVHAQQEAATSPRHLVREREYEFSRDSTQSAPQSKHKVHKSSDSCSNQSGKTSRVERDGQEYKGQRMSSLRSKLQPTTGSCDICCKTSSSVVSVKKNHNKELLQREVVRSVHMDRHGEYDFPGKRVTARPKSPTRTDTHNARGPGPRYESKTFLVDPMQLIEPSTNRGCGKGHLEQPGNRASSRTATELMCACPSEEAKDTASKCTAKQKSRPMCQN